MRVACFPLPCWLLVAWYNINVPFAICLWLVAAQFIGLIYYNIRDSNSKIQDTRHIQKNWGRGRWLWCGYIWYIGHGHGQQAGSGEAAARSCSLSSIAQIVLSSLFRCLLFLCLIVCVCVSQYPALPARSAICGLDFGPKHANARYACCWSKGLEWGITVRWSQQRRL